LQDYSKNTGTDNICVTNLHWQNELTGSVEEPEPVERPLFGGAGAQAQVFRPGSGSGYLNSYKMLQKVLNFSYKNLKLSSKKNLFVAFYFKEPFYDRFGF
jgi:hypothetical protein